MSDFTLDFPISSDPGYQTWLATRFPSRSDIESMRRATQELSAQLLLSVIVVVRDPTLVFLDEAIKSVRMQAYSRWQLCIVDNDSRDSGVRDLLARHACEEGRIQLLQLPRALGIVAALNAGLGFATGEFVVFFEHEDLLTADALYETATLIGTHPDADMIYTDEDNVDGEGKLSAPVFKPDWCPDSFLSRHYTGHLSVHRRSLVERIGRFRDGYDAGHSYDLALRLSEQTRAIHHIPKILYHSRLYGSSTAVDIRSQLCGNEAERRALTDAINRRGEPGEIVQVPGALGCYIVRYDIKRPHFVSVIIPSRDHGGMLHACLESIFTRTTYHDYEVVVVDNGSVEQLALTVIADWRKREPARFRCVPLDIPFNFSTLCNHGAEQARGDILLFLNNDTEVVTPDWMQAMVEQAQRPSIGAVGALLLYENGTIQHAGAILGLGGLAAHSHRGCSALSYGYMNQVVTVNNYSSVAGTCLMCRRDVFERAGRFDELLPGDYEDVDLCLKLRELGYHNVYLPHVQLFHYESVSRGKDYVARDPGQRAHATELIRKRWAHYIDHDPCYNPNLTRDREDYSLRVDGVPAAVTRYDPQLFGFLGAVDSVDVYAGQCLKLRGWATTWRGEPVERVAVEVSGTLDGPLQGDACRGYARGDVLREIGFIRTGYVGFNCTLRAMARFPPRISLRVTLFDAHGRSESYAFTKDTDPQLATPWTATLHRELERMTTAALSRATDLLRRLLDLPDLRTLGASRASAETVRHAAARLRLGGVLERFGRLAPAISDRLGLDLPLTQDLAYRRWLWREYPRRSQLLAMRRAVDQLLYRPTISFIMPVFNIEARYLSEAIESVRRQTYPDWELCIADDASTVSHVRPVLERYARRDSRIKVLFRTDNGNISAASNSALGLASGQYIAQLDHDDVIAPHALQEVVKLLNRHPEADFIYSDEDKIDLDGVHSQPFFKPDWSPETFLTKMYTCHLAVYRRSLVEEIGGFRSAFDGAEDYDLALRLSERTDRIFHVPTVLYHWRMHPASTATGRRDVKSWAYPAGVRAVQEAVDRRGEPGSVSRVAGTIGFYEVRYHLQTRDLVSIVIPMRDHSGALDRCLLSVFERSTYPKFEVIVVDDGSVDVDTMRVVSRWRERRPERCISLRLEQTNNSFSRLCNAGAAQSKGQFLLFLDSDTEVISPDWIEGMMQQAQRQKVGAVGPQLVHRNGTIQHAGIVLGIAGTAGHAHRGADAIAHGYFARIITVNNVSAVTGACLMCRREVFNSMSGFDGAFADVDLCLRLKQRGLRNVYIPFVRLYHLDLPTSRRPFDPRTDAAAVADFRSKWREAIDHDPYYSPNLTRATEDYGVY